jgi:hypothetical protein
VPQQSSLDVLELERGVEQRIVLQIDLPDRKIIGGAPIGMRFFRSSADRGAGMRISYLLVIPPPLALRRGAI